MRSRAPSTDAAVTSKELWGGLGGRGVTKGVSKGGLGERGTQQRTDR